MIKDLRVRPLLCVLQLLAHFSLFYSPLIYAY